MTDPVFVFGSNISGIHGKGAAKFAFEHRQAIMGAGEGIQGNSYAIPTKGALSQLTRRFPILPTWKIQAHVAVFNMFAHSRPDLKFQLTPIGCGLAGYRYSEIAPMFFGSPANVELPREFLEVIRQD